MKVFLVGLMAAGKSHLARALATFLGPDTQSIDLDSAVEAKAQLSIPELFARHGEAYFRALEQATLRELGQQPSPSIIATGGGCAAQPGAMAWMKAQGLVVWLDAPVEVLWQRAQAQGLGSRPLLTQASSPDEGQAALAALLAQRAPFYARAHVRLKATLPIEDLVRQVAQALSNHLQSPPSSATPDGSFKTEADMLAELTLTLSEHRSYPIEIYADLPVLPLVASIQRFSPRAKALFILSDTHVAPLYLEPLALGLSEAGYRVVTHVVAAGEVSKSFASFSEVLDVALSAKMGRDDAFIALGGGVIGDLCGFAAASYMRGVDFYQVPTSLLAQVDSSVGGKTGINHVRGKNLIGAFWQPKAVLIGVGVLHTLPERELRCGLAEALKHALLAEADLLDWMLEHADALRSAKAEAMAHLVIRCCAIKASFVGSDEREDTVSGQRALLNLGHTLGHAFETGLGYGVLTHGEAVGLGMVYAARLSERLGHAALGLEQTVVQALQALGLESNPDSYASQLGFETLLALAGSDKKASGQEVRFILLKGVGQPLSQRLLWTEIARHLEGP